MTTFFLVQKNLQNFMNTLFFLPPPLVFLKDYVWKGKKRCAPASHFSPAHLAWEISNGCQAREPWLLHCLYLVGKFALWIYC